MLVANMEECLVIEGKKVLVLIPARGGSKRLPGKNIRPLLGKPLIAWTIEYAKAERCVDRVVVSTDSSEIANVSREYGADVPWVRPDFLASDTATSLDVISHAVTTLHENGDQYDILAVLQPTTPFRLQSLLCDAIEKSIRAGGAPVVALGPARSHPGWCFSIGEDGKILSFGNNEDLLVRSQDLSPAYEITGSMYVIGMRKFIESRSFFTSETRCVVTEDRRYNVDIDDEIDWFVAESVAKSFKG